MRVLHTESSLNWGGQEYRILEQVRWLNENGHWSAIAARADSAIYQRANDWGLPVYKIPFRGSYAPSAVRALRRLVKREHIDVIDAHGGYDTATAGLARFLCPVIRSLHVMKQQKTSLSRRLQWRLSCDHVIATAACIRDQLVGLGLRESQHISVVGEWADEVFFQDRPHCDAHAALCTELHVPPATHLFAVIGMLRKDKGQEYFIAAAEKFLRQCRDARFLVVGAATASEPEYEALLKRQVDEAGLHDKILFLGYRDDVPQLMRGLDAVILTSVDVEAQSRIVPQAFASRVPVIANRVGGVPELVVDGETGCLVNVRDDDAITRAMLKIVNMPGFCQSLVDRAYDYAQKNLHIHRKMEETLAVYRQVIAYRGMDEAI